MDVFALLDELRAIARTGLHYTLDPFDRERYEALLELAAHEYAERSGVDAPAIRARFDADIGYQTAKVGADAAVFDQRDRILLVKRVDDGKWGLVAGWIDSNESPEATVVRELAEETGLTGRVEQLVGVFFRQAQAGEHPHGTVSVLYLCSVDDAIPSPQPHEVTDVAWRAIEEITAGDWHHHHEMLARAARDAHWRRRAGA